MDQVEDTKMATREYSWNPISNEDDDDSASQGSTLSINSWELHFDVLREHMCVDYPNGGFVPSDRYSPELGDWISLQRVQYHRKRCGCACPLSDFKIQKLEDIGFWWEDGNPRQEIIESAPPDVVASSQKLKRKKEMPSRKSKEWTRNFEKLKNHMESHDRLGGNGLCSECSDELGCWVEDQRRLYWEKKNVRIGLAHTISDDQIRKLQKIGVSLSLPSICYEAPNPVTKKLIKDTSKPHSSRKQSPGATKSSAKKQKTDKKLIAWETHFDRLVKYVDHHGSGYILPRTPDKKFNRWVCRQRSDYKLSRMSHDRIQKLERIGFLWERPGKSTSNEEPCSSEDDASGWLTQEEEELDDSHYSNRGSPGDHESQDSAGQSAAESSSDSEPSTLEERDSNATKTKSHRKPTAVKASMCTDLDYDGEISNFLHQIAMYCRKTKSCLQKKALVQAQRELALKKKNSAYKASLCASKKEIQGHSQKARKIEEKIHVLRGRVEQLEKQNKNLTQDLVAIGDQNERYKSLLEAHKLERERRFQADENLEKLENQQS